MHQCKKLKGISTCVALKKRFILYLRVEFASADPQERGDGRVGYGARLRLHLNILPGHESGVGSSPTLINRP